MGTIRNLIWIPVLLIGMGCGDSPSPTTPASTLYVAGTMSNSQGTGTRIVRLREDGSVDTSFKIVADASINELVKAEDGSGDLYVAGDFTFINGYYLPRLARLNSDGTVDFGFIPRSFDGTVFSVYALRDGSGDVYIGGAFNEYDSEPMGGIVRLNSNATRDTSLDGDVPTGFDGAVTEIKSTNDGTSDIYVSGAFTTFDGTTVNRIARLTSTGVLNNAFDVSGATDGFNFPVVSLEVSSNGTRVYAGGGFTQFNSIMNRNRLVMLTAGGNLNNNFNIGSTLVATSGFTGTVNSGLVQKIALIGDGSGDLYVAGFFNMYNGAANTNRIVRLQNTGSINTAFQTGTGFDSSTHALLPTSSDGVYVGGAFSSYNGQATNSIAKLNADGSLDTSFTSPFSSGDTVSIIIPY